MTSVTRQRANPHRIADRTPPRSSAMLDRPTTPESCKSASTRWPLNTSPPNSYSPAAMRAMTTQSSSQNNNTTHLLSKPRRRKYGPKPEPPYFCFCGKVFKRHEHMLRHRATHDDGIKYDCNICGKSFRRQDVMHRHTLTHKGDHTKTASRIVGRMTVRRQPTSSGAASRSRAVYQGIERTNFGNPRQVESEADVSNSTCREPARPVQSHSESPSLNRYNSALPEHESPLTFDARAMSLPLEMNNMGANPPPPFYAPALLNHFPFGSLFHHPRLDEIAHDEDSMFAYGGESVDGSSIESVYHDDASEWTNDGTARDFYASPRPSSINVFSTTMTSAVFSPHNRNLRSNLKETRPVFVPSQSEAQSSLTGGAAATHLLQYHEVSAIPMYLQHGGLTQQWHSTRAMQQYQHETPRYDVASSSSSCGSNSMDASLSAQHSFPTTQSTWTNSGGTSEVFANSGLSSSYVHVPQPTTPTPMLTRSRSSRAQQQTQIQMAQLSPYASSMDARSGPIAATPFIDPFTSASPLTDISDLDSLKTSTAHFETAASGRLSHSDPASPATLRLEHLPTLSLSIS